MAATQFNSSTRKASSASKTTIVLAFAGVYFFWGSTYTAIRIGAPEMPALLLAGTRFLDLLRDFADSAVGLSKILFDGVNTETERNIGSIVVIVGEFHIPACPVPCFYRSPDKIQILFEAKR